MATGSRMRLSQVTTGLSSTWPESKIKNKAEPKSNLGGLG